MEKYPDLRVEVLSGVQSVNLHRRDADLAIRMVKPESGNLTLKRLGKVGALVCTAPIPDKQALPTSRSITLTT